MLFFNCCQTHLANKAQDKSIVHEMHTHDSKGSENGKSEFHESTSNSKGFSTSTILANIIEVLCAIENAVCYA
jgi:hypothetical protein